LRFDVESNTTDIVEAYNNDTTGAVALALQEAIAAPIEGASAENVTILGVQAEVRRLTLTSLRGRSLQTNTGIVVDYVITLPASLVQNATEVAAALTSDTAVAVIEEALVAELQAIDPSLTVTSLQVEATVVQVTTVTTTVSESFASCRYSMQWALMLAAGMAAALMN